MVLTHAVQLDVLHHHHFVHAGFEHGVVHQLVEVLLVTPGQELHGLGGAHGGIPQTFAVAVFTEAFDNGPVVACEVIKEFAHRCVQLTVLPNCESLREFARDLHAIRCQGGNGRLSGGVPTMAAPAALHYSGRV